jgi:hypothetical protein
LPPAPGGLGLTNISQQSQFNFTATVYSREPEISYSTGRPRFDLFKFNTVEATNSSKMSEVTNDFLNAFNLNYPSFNLKYSLPQFVSSIRSITTKFKSGNAAVTNYTYTPSGGETPNFNTRSLPLINETEFLMKVKSDGNKRITILESRVELIFLSKADDFTPGWNKDQYIFDELHMSGSRFESQATNFYRARVSIKVGNNTFTNMELNPVLTNWFTNHKANIKTLKPYNTNLTGLFAVLSGNLAISTNTDLLTTVVWEAPTQIETKISYGNTNSNFYHTINSIQTNYNGIFSNTISNTNGEDFIYWWTSFPRGDQGVRGDPRLGLHSAVLKADPNTTNALGSNPSVPSSSIGSLNTSTWKPETFDTDGLYPDITPPYCFFEIDRSFNYAVQPNYPPKGDYFMSSGDLGEVPITTFKNDQHLSWSTPRFWGNGRTNLGDNRTYPPDWFMLDCVHTAMFPPNTNRPFSTYPTNFVSHGRLNVNGLKSFFQIPEGSSHRSDTVMDSIIVKTSTKDFGDHDSSEPNTNGRWYGRWIPNDNKSRTNLLNYINDHALQKGASDNPYLTSFDFTAHIAGNTNSNLTNVGNWEFYTPGKTNTTESRIESLVRSLQQRVTSRGFQFSVFSLGQSVQVVQTGSTYKTNVIGESYFQAVWERAPKHDTNGIISNASSGGVPPLRLLYMRELR